MDSERRAAVSVRMKYSKNLEEYLLIRNRSINKLNKAVLGEKTYLNEKQYGVLFQSLNDIDKYHKKYDKKVSELTDILIEIEGILEELKYE